MTAGSKKPISDGGSAFGIRLKKEEEGVSLQLDNCRESVRNPWGGRSSRDNMKWTDHSPHSSSPCAIGGGESEKTGSKVESRKKWGMAVGVPNLGLFLLTLTWLVINLINFLKFSLFHLWWYLVRDLSLSLSRLMSLSLHFLSPPLSILGAER